MKNIILFITAITIISCSQETEIDYAIVSGEIINKSDDNLILISKDGSQLEFIKVAEDGTFRDTIIVEKGKYTYTLKGKKDVVNLYLTKSNDIVINFNSNDFQNSISITGKGSEVSRYLLSKDKKSKELLSAGTDIYLLEEDDYKSKMNEVKTVLLNELDAVEGISEDFKKKEKRNINYSYLSFLSKYESYHNHFSKKKDFKASEGFLNELNDITYNNEEDFLFSRDYENLVVEHYQKQAIELAEKEELENDISFLKVASEIDNEIIKNKLLYVNSVYGITYTEKLEEFYAIFMAGCTNEKYRKEITDSYNKLKILAKE